MSIRRINLFGGPGCAKSTTAARVFGELKMSGMTVEFVPEYIKTWAIEKRRPQSWDQLYILSKQIYTEDRILRQGIPLVVCECPLLVNCTYAKYYDSPGWREMIQLAMEFEGQYPSLNILLLRDGLPYVKKGRYQNKRQAREVDRIVREMMDECVKNYYPIPAVDFPLILSSIQRGLSL